eukprot:1142368-Pelagomonas_calceolata.AAC.5
MSSTATGSSSRAQGGEELRPQLAACTLTARKQAQIAECTLNASRSNVGYIHRQQPAHSPSGARPQAAACTMQLPQATI